MASTINLIFLASLAVFCLLVPNTTAQAPSISANGLFVVGQTKTILCYITSSQGSTAGDFPLKWTRESNPGVVLQASESSTAVSGTTLRSYTSSITVTVQKEMNMERFTCTSYLGSGGSGDWTIYVHKPPDLPSVTGPTRILSSQNSTWTCRVTGASSAPNVYWQFGNGSRIFTGVTDLQSTITEDPDWASYIRRDAALRLYNVGINLTLNVPVGSASFLLSCVAIHKDTETRKVSDISVTVEYPPQVGGHANYTVTVGAQAVLNCQASAVPAITAINWYKDNNLLAPSSRYRGSTPDTPSLTIVSVEKEDAGRYVCRASNSLGSEASEASYVTVRYVPMITYTTTTFGGNLGEDVVLPCPIDAQPAHTTVFWYKVSSLTGAKIQISITNNPTKYSGGSQSTPALTIKNLQSTDAGLYRCAADNNVGRGEGPNISVQVYFAPVVTTGPIRYDVKKGNNLTIPCSFVAKPAPYSVLWYRYSLPLSLPSNDGRMTGGSLSAPALVITNVQPADSATYRCQVTSNRGMGSTDNITVAVYYAPVVTVGATSYVRNSGESLQIPCSYDSNPSASRVTWTKNSQTIDVINSGGKYSGSTIDRPSLTIFGLASTDAGLYVCKVENAAGPGYSSDVSVVVNYSPQVNSTVTLHNKGKGETVTLQCAVTANPAPTSVTWYANNVPLVITGSGGKYSGGTVSNPDLTIYFLAGSDTADYFCRVQNSLGTADGPLIRVNVLYPPTITSSTSTVSGNEGTALTIPCTYDAYPLPTSVVWLKSGIVIDVTNRAYSGGTPGTPSLTIVDLQQSDAGSYVCSVTNSRGTGSSGVIPVSVNYRPQMDLSGPDDLSAEQGQTVTIPCNFNAAPAVTSVIWLRNGIVIDTSNPNDYRGGTTLTPALTILDLQGSDNGFYRCRVANAVGTSEGKNISVFVSFKPEITVQDFLQGNESNTLVVPCNVNALPPITSLTWYKGGKLMDTSNATLYSGGTTASPSLTILSLKPGDAGLYYCVATNSKGTTFSGTTTLTVNYKPIVTGPSEVGGKELDTITLDVTLAAYPSATNIRWRKRGALPNTYTDINLLDPKYGGGTLSNPGLQIRNLATSDVGVYVLEVTNSFGTTTFDVTVAVSYKPSVPTITGLESAYKEGEIITLTCSADGFPSPQYRWYRNNVLYVPEGQTQGAVFRDAATPANNAAFKCEAYNTEGANSTTVSALVRYKPRQSGSLQNYTAGIGESVTLTCAVDANPEPSTYTWTHNNQVLYSGDSSTLTVTIFNSTDQGAYRCTATNTEGSTSPSIVVYINEPPPFESTTPRIGQSTEDEGGLSTATLILIVIICIIILVVLILVIVYCCSNRKCMRKDNNVEPSRPAVVPVPHYAQKSEPLMMNGIYNNKVPQTTTQNGRIDMEDDTPKRLPSAANGSIAPAFTRLGNGLSISVPGGGTPRPHHLPPLGQDGDALEQEPAQEDKTKDKKKKRKRKRKDEAPRSNPETPHHDVNGSENIYEQM